jgi:hypothetical protein
VWVWGENFIKIIKEKGKITKEKGKKRGRKMTRQETRQREKKCRLL